MKRVVVFCSDVYSSIGLIRSLGEAGYRPECYYYGPYGHYILSSKYISVGKHFETENDVLFFLLNEYPVYEDKPVLLTVPDPPAYLVDLYYEDLSKKFILQSAGGQGRVGYWMDKRNISSLALKHGLSVPWCIEIAKDSILPTDIVYPVFTKSLKSIDGGKEDEHICENKEDLQKVQNEMKSDRLLVMQFIRKKKEINYFGLSVKGNVYIDYNDVRDRFPKDGLGFYNKFLLCEKDDLYYRIIEMMKETQYEGLFDVEFLLGNDGVMYFMEVNFRVDGEMYKLCEGINLPALWCSLSTVGQNELPKQLLVGSKSFTGMFEIQDFKYCVKTGLVNPFVWLWQFVTADRHSLFNIRDPKPVLIFFIDVIRRRLPLKKSKK